MKLRRAALTLLCTAGLLMLGCEGALAATPPRLSASAAVLIDPATGQVLYGHDASARLAIASTTKLMTALVTLEHVHRLSRLMTQNNWTAAPADSQIGLVPGERMSVHDLLLALLIPSADDAAEDLAYNVGHGSVRRFVAMMNAQARALHLTNTHYTTPSGLDTPGNYSSAADLVTLASYELSKEPFLRRAVAASHAVLRTGNHVRYVTSTNDLLGRYRSIDGVKTGHTAQAGYVLVASAHEGKMVLLSAVLGTVSAAARDANTLTLLGYGFDNFALRSPVVAGTVLARPTVKYRSGEHAVVVAGASFSRVYLRGERIATRVTAPAQLSGPLPYHSIVGNIAVLLDGRTVARIPLLLARALPAVSAFTIAAEFVTRPATLLVLALVLCLGIWLIAFRRGRMRSTGAAGRKPA